MDGAGTPRGLIAGAMAAVLAVGGLVVLALGDPRHDGAALASPSAPVASSVTAIPAATPSVSVRPPAVPESWDLSRAELPIAPDQTHIRSVWALAEIQMFVALAEDHEPGTPELVVLSSGNGRDWELREPPEAGFVVQAGTLIGDELWLAGFTGEPGSTARWRLWSTPDAGTWTDRGDMRDFVPDGGVLLNIAGAGAGFVATIQGPQPDENTGGTPQIRYSADGRDWTLVDMPGLAINTRVAGLTSDGDRWLVAIQTGDDADSLELEVRTSLDGRDWSGTGVSASGGFAICLAYGASGFVLGGAQLDSEVARPVVWTSADGGFGTWSMSSFPIPPDRDVAAVVQALSTPTGFLALGNSSGDAWVSSADASIWSYRNLFPPNVDGSLNGVTSIGDTFIVAGQAMDGAAEMWFGSLPAVGL